MLESARIQGRQSEIRQSMAGLSAKTDPTEDERRSMDELHSEYTGNESRYRAALVAEDDERRDAGAELEGREQRDWASLVGDYELRQVAQHLDDGTALSGQTAEVVEEMRSQGGYRGTPMPVEALEQRAGETVSSGVPDPVSTRNIIDRLFPQSSAAAMGTRMVNIGSGSAEYPIVTDGVSSSWQGSETGTVGGPDQFKTSPFKLAPDHTLGTQVQVTRKSLLQAANLEAAIRRDLRTEIGKELDRAIFQGSGTGGEPNGIVSKANAAYGITEFDASASSLDYTTFVSAVAAMMADNAANGMAAVRALVRSEVWTYADGQAFDTGSGLTVWDKITSKLGNVAISDQALAAPATNVSKALLTTNAGGLAPIFVGTWGGIDLIRDPYSKAQSGQLLITGLLTTDVSASRAEQLRVVKVKSA